MATCPNTTGKYDPELCSSSCCEEEHYFTAKCYACGEPVEICNGAVKMFGEVHRGCFGFPYCMCKAPHRGQCDVVNCTCGWHHGSLPGEKIRAVDPDCPFHGAEHMRASRAS